MVLEEVPLWKSYLHRRRDISLHVLQGGGTSSAALARRAVLLCASVSPSVTGLMGVPHRVELEQKDRGKA